MQTLGTRHCQVYSDGVTAWPTDALRTCKLHFVATKVRKKIVATRVGDTFGVTFVAPFVAPDRALFLQPTRRAK